MGNDSSRRWTRHYTLGVPHPLPHRFGWYDDHGACFCDCCAPPAGRQRMTLPDLPASTHIAAVHLHVSDLQQSLAFYSDLLGFRPLRSSGNEVWLSATGDAPHQLHLTEFENARPRPSRAT
ncbi:MAG: hypothetical protein HOB49_17245, partial [Gemmatimonadetes bacterium]|nr:hypothetical protein [Gemmatimonadota bacterium]